MSDVTILFPTIRTDKYYDIAKASIINQTCGNIQLIEDSLPRKNNAYSFNACLEKANGDIITFVYDDDICLQDKCLILKLYADKFPDVGVFYTSQILIDSEGKIGGYLCPPEFEMKHFKEYGNYVSTGTSAIRRSCIGDTRFNPDFPYTHEYLFFYELAQKGVKFKRIDMPTMMVRVHKGQLSAKYHYEKAEEHEKLKQYLDDEKVYSNRRYTKHYLREIAGEKDG